jgi:hypothetical protein
MGRVARRAEREPGAEGAKALARFLANNYWSKLN